MSTLDIFLEKGKKIGLEEGIEKGVEIGLDKALYKNTRSMLLKGFPKETICDALEVTMEYVAKIREEIKAEK